MRPVFAHIKNTENLGDLNCSPQQYFPQFADCRRIDVTEVDSLPRGQAVIVGGGGLFMLHTQHHFARWSETRPVIVWGAGLNYPSDINYEYELVGSLKQCALVGVRNPELAYKHNFEYVPCASCLHPAFDPLPGERRGYKVLFYQHADALFAPAGQKSMTNQHPDVNEVLARFRESEYIITNSFHGAYWGLCMQRRVMLWKPEQFGNRCDHLTISPRVESFKEILERIDEWVPWVGSSYRNLCRTKNKKFAQKVEQYLALL